MKEPPTSPYRRAGILLDCLLLFLLAAGMVKPLFKAKYLNLWGSIESTFIADARFLKEHGPHPRWQPLWYCGTRFDYIYPPALRYGTALLSNIWIPVKAYHVYIAFFFCAGISGVYLLVRLMSGSRVAAWLGAAGVALLSPSFLFIKEVRYDAFFLAPLRLSALVRYGEGPHMSALAILPFALVASFLALRRKQPVALGMAALLCALVVSTNFYGATALAIFFPILVWTVWVTYQDRRVWLRAASIAALAYGLTAFWLVPSYIRVTIDNLRLVAQPGNSWSFWLAYAVAVGFATVSFRVCRARPDHAYPLFVAGSLLFISLNVLGYYAFGFRVAGEPGRLIPELDLVIILGVVELLRRARSIKTRVLVAVVIAVAFLPATKFLPRAWRLYQPEGDYQKRVEYRITDWLARNLPDARTMATGSVRFWYDAWHDLAQVGGGSEQGLMNRSVPIAMSQIQAGENPELATLWMIALGVDAVVVHDRNSQEVYHDFQHLRQFANSLQVLYDDSQGNVIYKVPRRYPGLARVVEKRQFEALKPVESDNDSANVRAYADAVEKGPDAPPVFQWDGTDAMRIRATIGAGQILLVQATYDTSWRAYAERKPLQVRKDPVMGFMVVDAPPGEHEIKLIFELPLENLVGRAVTILSLVTVGLLLASGVRLR